MKMKTQIAPHQVEHIVPSRFIISPSSSCASAWCRSSLAKTIRTKCRSRKKSMSRQAFRGEIYDRNLNTIVKINR
ncbi:hypothetical protein PO124_08250 [Bacillus licheniformis]|nr:hypothetical protein [Bacillus licheniformis]